MTGTERYKYEDLGGLGEELNQTSEGSGCENEVLPFLTFKTDSILPREEDATDVFITDGQEAESSNARQTTWFFEMIEMRHCVLFCLTSEDSASYGGACA